MKTRNRASLIAFSLLAVLVTACGGDSKSSPATTKATNPPVVTTVADPTTTPAPPTTIEETTTTAAAPDDSYQLDTVTLDCETVPGQCTGAIPADFPTEAQNPNHPGLTLGGVMILQSGDAVCVHTPTNDLPGEIGDEGVAIKSFGGENPYIGIQVIAPDGSSFWLDAFKNGVSPAPNGVDWVDEEYITEGGC